jgi:hypothetical protein
MVPVILFLRGSDPNLLLAAIVRIVIEKREPFASGHQFDVTAGMKSSWGRAYDDLFLPVKLFYETALLELTNEARISKLFSLVVVNIRPSLCYLIVS